MMKFLKYFSTLMVIIGALNWGIIGLFGFDLVATLFGEMTALTRIIYSIIGISAIIFAICAYTCHRRCHEDLSY